VKSELFLVTYAKDYDFTSYTLRSIAKFSRGFAGITIVVPTHDEARFRSLAKKHDCNLRSYFESESKGFLHHQVCKCEADLWCPRDRDLIFHIDADCVFKEPFSPETFLRSGKPILVRERFDDFKHYAARYSWKQCAEYALGVEMEWETMVRHPGVFWRDLYPRLRAHVEQRHHYPFTQYVLLQRNEFPQSFAEFPTLGGYALAFDKGRYSVITKVGTPCEWWASQGVEVVERDAKGVPAREINFYLDEFWSRVTIGDPVRYFWSRAGVTTKIRKEIEDLLGS
jgi:hypothetical protein